MDGLLISEVAAATGFSSSALRYYEGAGLVRPDRTASGYRIYGERTIDALHFIARAKRLGLTLTEITDLVGLLDGDRCEPVQQRLRELVTAKIADAEQREADLRVFRSELERVRAALGRHTPEGRCDDQCGCTSDVGVDTRATPRPVAVVVGAKPTAAPPTVAPQPIACTLAPEAIPDRLRAWQELARKAQARGIDTGGAWLRFDRSANASAIADLMAAEQSCCAFLTFTLTVSATDTTLHVAAPEGAQALAAMLVGAVESP